MLLYLLRLQKKEQKSGFEISSSQYEKGPTVICIVLSVSRAGFLNLGIIILSQIILCYTVLLNCRTFSSVPGFYPAEARNTCVPSVVTTKNVSRNCQVAPWAQTPPSAAPAPHIVNHCSRRMANKLQQLGKAQLVQIQLMAFEFFEYFRKFYMVEVQYL